jgi:F0F1-type ATP synthase assembly protein I
MDRPSPQSDDRSADPAGSRDRDDPPDRPDKPDRSTSRSSPDADTHDDEAPTPPRKPKGRADWYQKTSAASLGIEMAIAIVLCTFAGMWLQNNVTHWQPWTMLIGFTFGVGAAVNAIIRVIREEEAARLEREAARRAAAIEASANTTDDERDQPSPLSNERERD